MAALEAEAQAAAEQAEAEGKEHSEVPEDKAQRNFTDAESRIMPAPGGRDFLQAYNCQAVVDHTHQVIVAARATNQTSDKRQAAAMMQETIGNVGAVPREVSADAGYDPPKVVDQPHDVSVEPVFGQIKEGRGFRQFLLRGLEKVQAEWSLICTGHNLLKLFRFGRLLADDPCHFHTWTVRPWHRQHPVQQVA